MRIPKPFIISFSVHIVIVLALIFLGVKATKFLKPQPHSIKLVAGRETREESPATEEAPPQPEVKPPQPETPKLVTRKRTVPKLNPVPKISKLKDPKPEPIKPVKTAPAKSSSRAKGSISTGSNSFWDGIVQEKIKSNWSQPARALVGTNVPAVEFEIVVARSGKITSINKKKSSGVPALDKSAFEALKKSDPLPKLPDYYKEVQKTVPITFRITDEF